MLTKITQIGLRVLHYSAGYKRPETAVKETIVTSDDGSSGGATIPLREREPW